MLYQNLDRQQNPAIQFVAEVVSSNWQNDYARKVEDYALLEIPEYWIADYAAIGGEDFILA
jgi:Uma2 family endonuclease